MPNFALLIFVFADSLGQLFYVKATKQKFLVKIATFMYIKSVRLPIKKEVAHFRYIANFFRIGFDCSRPSEYVL